MQLTIEIYPRSRTARFREVTYLSAGDVCSPLTLSGVRGADQETLSLALYRDARSFTAVAAVPPGSFSAVPGHPSLADAESLRLDTEELAEWFSDAVRSFGAEEEESDDGPGPAEAERAVRADGWLVVADASRVWAACRVPVLLAPFAAGSAVPPLDPLSVTVRSLVAAALLDQGVADIPGKLDGAAAYPAWTRTPPVPYAVGQMASHRGRIWRCTVAGTAAEPSAAGSGWGEVLVGSLIAGKQDALTDAQLEAVNSGASEVVLEGKRSVWDLSVSMWVVTRGSDGAQLFFWYHVGSGQDQTETWYALVDAADLSTFLSRHLVEGEQIWNLSVGSAQHAVSGSASATELNFSIGGVQYSARRVEGRIALDSDLSGYVPAENGKGLSSNDFTSAYKGKLDGLDAALERKLAAESAYPAWEQKAYSQGDVVSYKGELFKAFEDVPSGSGAPYDNSSWVPATIGELKQDALGFTPENAANKVTTLSAQSTDAQYPSAKCVHDGLDAKANKSEMSVTNGTGANADKTTIQLKTGTSATVLREHQDVSGKLDGAAAYPAWDSTYQYEDSDTVSYGGRIWFADGTPTLGSPPGEDMAWYETSIGVYLSVKQNLLSPAQLAAVNSGATAQKVATWDGYAAQIAAKANATDLPYSIYTPQLDTYTNWDVEWTGSSERATMEWVGNGWRLNGSEDGIFLGGDETSTHFEGEAVSYGFDTYSATRSLGYGLHDRANNLVDASTGNVTLTLPQFNNGKVRDLLVACTIGLDGNDEPWSVIFQGQGSEAPSGEYEISFKVEGDDAASATFPVPDAAGDWWYSLTERAPHVFAVSLKQLQSVSQPTQGGS